MAKAFTKVGRLIAIIKFCLPEAARSYATSTSCLVEGTQLLANHCIVQYVLNSWKPDRCCEKSA